MSYNDRSLPEFYITTDNSDPGSGDVINQVKRIYNPFGLLIADQQEHDGVVNGSNPEVTYAFTGGSGNILRRTAVVPPSGAQVNPTYGSSGSITDVFNQGNSLKVKGESDNLVDYTFGIGRVVTLRYPKPGVELSYLTLSTLNLRHE